MDCSSSYISVSDIWESFQCRSAMVLWSLKVLVWTPLHLLPCSSHHPPLSVFHLEKGTFTFRRRNLPVFYIIFSCYTKTFSIFLFSNALIVSHLSYFYVSFLGLSVKMLRAIERTHSCGLPRWTRSSLLFLLALGCLLCLCPPAGKLHTLM